MSMSMPEIFRLPQIPHQLAHTFEESRSQGKVFTGNGMIFLTTHTHESITQLKHVNRGQYTLYTDARCRFINQVYCFIWLIATRKIARRELNSGMQRFITNGNTMEIFIASTQPLQDSKGFLSICFCHQYRLEATL